jgi:class 3 adenylate cyclase
MRQNLYMSQPGREVPPIRYTRTPAGVHIAYQVVGSGPPDIIQVPVGWSHLEMRWEWPAWAHLNNRLASFSRSIAFDKPGMGLSDRDVPVPTIDNQLDEVLAVMDAAGAKRPVLFGLADGAALACLVAASHPERVQALVLYAFAADLTDAAVRRRDLGLDWDQLVAVADESWGEAVLLELVAPSAAKAPAMREWWSRYQRAAASPSTVRAWADVWRRIDITAVLSTVRVPTLVIHRTGDRLFHIAAARRAAALIPGARFVELPGNDFAIWAGDVDAVVDEIEAFVTGTRPLREPDRMLASMLFTDIVDSTGHASRLGDRAWRELLDQHDDAARRAVDGHRGRLIKCTGDGMLATFDRPAHAVQAAAAFRDAVGVLGIDIRSGVHIGEVEQRDEDIGGVSVHVAARVQALAQPGEVLVTRTIVDLVAGSGLNFTDRGQHELKGLKGTWPLFALAP